MAQSPVKYRQRSQCSVRMPSTGRQQLQTDSCTHQDLKSERRAAPADALSNAIASRSGHVPAENVPAKPHELCRTGCQDPGYSRPDTNSGPETNAGMTSPSKTVTTTPEGVTRDVQIVMVRQRHYLAVDHNILLETVILASTPHTNSPVTKHCGKGERFALWFCSDFARHCLGLSVAWVGALTIPGWVSPATLRTATFCRVVASPLLVPHTSSWTVRLWTPLSLRPQRLA